MLAISISLIVIGVARGYKNNIELEISNIEPDILLSHPEKDFIFSKDINSFINKNTSFASDSIIYAKYINSYAMIKKNNNSKGIMIYAMEKEKINQIFNFNYLEEYESSDNFLFISKSLYDKMILPEDEELYIFNIERMLQDETIQGIKNDVTGIYETNIKTFDEKVIFMSLKSAQDLLQLDSKSYSGLMIENANNDYLKKIESKSDFIYQTWEEKHYNLLNWLMIFSNPIKLILIFILSLSIIYKVFTFWLILYDKTSSLSCLKILGVPDKIINKISLNIIILLSLFSIVSGSILALIISSIQNAYQIITVDPSIYILSNIYSIVLVSDIIYLSTSTLFILILLTKIITYFKFKKIILTTH